MPLKIERQLTYGVFIGQIKDLLEQQHPQSGVEFLGGSSISLTKAGSDFVHRKLTKNVFPKQSSPGSIQEVASFLAEEAPWIEKIGCVVISGANHLLCP
jgi:hypothetical protein